MKLKKNGIARKEYKPGRVTKTNKEMWDRRVKEYRLWSMGITKTEIARQFNLTYPAVTDDIKAVAALEPIVDIKEKIDASFNEIIRTAFEKINKEGIPEGAKVGYLHEINEAVSRRARIHGLDKGDSYTINATTNILTGVNIYAKWDDSRLQEEFKRRRLTIKSSNNGEGAA